MNVFPVDFFDGLVDFFDGSVDSRCGSGHAEHSTAGGDEAIRPLSRAGMKDLYPFYSLSLFLSL